jgi:hypothetical protein
MAAPVINTVVKNAPNLQTNWVEGTDWGWADPYIGTQSTSYVDGGGTTSDNANNGQYNLPAEAIYIVNRGSLDCNHNSYTAYVQTLHDGVIMAGGSYSNAGTTLRYHEKSLYGSKYEYSLQDNDFGYTLTLGTAVTVAKMQSRVNNAAYWSWSNNSVSWFLKSKADTLLADKISCCSKSTAGQNSGKMYVDSFTFICHGNGSLLNSGLYRYNNSEKYFPTHQVKNMIDGLNYNTGGTSILNGDYAIFIEGVFLEMT